MKKVLKSLILVLILSTVFVAPIYAASSKYLPQAEKFYNRYCSSKYRALSTATTCYLYEKAGELTDSIASTNEKVNEQDSVIAGLSSKIIDLEEENEQQDQKISDLEDRVTGLESAQTQDPLDIIFFDDVDILTTTSQSSDWYDSSNYSELVLTYQCKAYASTSEYGASVSLLVSNDKITSVTVLSVSRAECHSGGSTTVDVGGKYYQVVIGNNTNLVNPPMTAYVAGRFR